jgi:hypothetical protein
MTHIGVTLNDFLVYSLYPKKVSFFTFRHLFWLSVLFKIFCINIIYFVMTYFIISDTLIMVYLFYNLHKIFEKDKRSNTMSKSKKRHSFWDGGSTWKESLASTHVLWGPKTLDFLTIDPVTTSVLDISIGSKSSFATEFWTDSSVPAVMPRCYHYRYFTRHW